MDLVGTMVLILKDSLVMVMPGMVGGILFTVWLLAVLTQNDTDICTFHLFPSSLINMRSERAPGSHHSLLSSRCCAISQQKFLT